MTQYEPYEEYDITERVGSVNYKLNIKKGMTKFDFLGAPRFWALVIGAVVIYLKTKGIFGVDEMVLVNTILGGFITIRTIDRATEKVGGSLS